MPYTINTNPITSITNTTAVSGGNSITLSGAGVVSSRGLCWSTTINPDINDTVYDIPGPSTSNFTHTIPSLTAGTTYYVRAYVRDSISPTPNTYYGNQQSFITQNIITTAASSITSTSAVSGGTFTGVTGNISSAGVCWDISTNPDPDINDSKATSIIIGGSFTTNIMGLLPNTTYKIRCFIQTNVGVVYGDVKTFTTLSTLPTVTTSPAVSSVTSTSFIISGNVTASGGASVTNRGIRRSLNPSMSPYIDVPATVPTGTGGFITNVTGLTPGTTYYIRAFATNTNGTSFGNIESLATLGGPTVVTIEPYSITNNSAITGCDVTFDGGTPITARGICYSSVQTLPATSNSTVINDPNYAQAEPFVTQLINLDNATTYYVRAFATNSVSTLYGETEIFRTTECNPFVEDCNPVDPIIECAEQVCVYNIPSACAIYNGDSITCDNESFSSVPSNTVLVNNVKFIGSITTTVLTVTSMIEGTLVNGTVIDAVGVTANTSIVAQLTGVIGGIGTYTINNSQTVTLRIFKNLRYSADVLLNNINNSLCSIYSRQYMIDMLTTIKNTYYLQNQFCAIMCSNEECACTVPG